MAEAKGAHAQEEAAAGEQPGAGRLYSVAGAASRLRRRACQGAAQAACMPAAGGAACKETYEW